MTALATKLRRDLWHARGQALAAAVVVACAVAVSVGSTATGRALLASRDAFYAESALADVFAEAVRVPEPVAARVAALPGVAEVETRIVADGRVDHAGGTARARLVSLGPDGGRLNRLHVRRGRLPGPGEAAVSEGFAVAAGVEPGDRLTVTVNGRREPVVVSGVALSAEHVYAMAPGSLFPDDRGYGVLWLPRPALAAALDLEGAFDALSVRLSPGASREDAVDAIDRVLGEFGTLGAEPRERLVSHRFVTDELRQLDAMATVLPAIFLGVAAFLVSVTLTRLVAMQRMQVGTLKALGYRNRDLALHYAAFAAVIAAAGVAAGVGMGHLLGRTMARIYAEFYRFPRLDHATDLASVLRAAALALGAALAGAAGAVRQAVRLPPAEAMRPPAPGRFRRTLLERAGLAPGRSPVVRMALRNLGRRPARALLGTLGLASATAILVTGAFFDDAIAWMARIALEDALRGDVVVTFVHAESPEAVRELARLPGVTAAEPARSAPAIVRHGSRHRTLALTGMPPGGELSRVLGVDGRVAPVPQDGVLLSARLAALLEVRPGEALEVELLDGSRRRGALRVAGTVDDALGLSATCSPGTLARLAGDPGRVSGAVLSVDRGARPAVARALEARPGVAAASWRTDALASFQRTLGETVLAYALILVGFAASIAAGVVYSAVRTSFAERERELATLRVIGFRRGESWRVLLGEVGAQVLAALPLGALLGLGLAALSASAFSNDLFRIPVVVERTTWLFACGTTFGAALLTSLVARRWVARLDLVRALSPGE
ncbi:MAG: FtsX-like permease family protein [Anaeromyxobacter sp.]